VIYLNKKTLTKEDIEEMRWVMIHGGLAGLIALVSLILGYISLNLIQIDDIRVINTVNSIRETYNSVAPFIIGVLLIFIVYVVIPYYYYRNKVPYTFR